MGGMMGAITMGWWILLWSLLGVALAVTGGVLVARVLSSRHRAGSRQIRVTESPGLQEARDALRLRYANGEISREDYLQGKVELED
jgi:putative membrane protein